MLARSSAKVAGWRRELAAAIAETIVGRAISSGRKPAHVGPTFTIDTHPVWVGTDELPPFPQQANFRPAYIDRLAGRRITETLDEPPTGSLARVPTL